jgi:hypothetical protein
MQKLLVYQSLWSMEQLPFGGPEWSLPQKLEMIRDAGFDGCGLRFIDADYARQVTRFLRAHNMTWQAQSYPQTVDDLKHYLALVQELGADHLNLQADVRPYTPQGCVPYLEGWQRLAADAGVKLHIETHRNRMTNDLLFTLHLLDMFPDLRFTADISHYVVGREFAWPVGDEQHAMIHRILDNSWGIHGRVASCEQIQVPFNFPQHQDWLALFLGWWEYTIRSWKKRAGPDETFTFLCECGPPPYAITGADGRELSDRWQEALQMKDMIRALWSRIQQEG